MLWLRVVRSFNAMNVGDVYEADDNAATRHLIDRGFVEAVEPAVEPATPVGPVKVTGWDEEGDVDGELSA